MRPSRIEHCMYLAVVTSRRSTCDRLKVGCVIVDTTGHILSTGYNGSVPGAPHCTDVGHYMINGSCKRAVHAEQNAIGHAARIGGGSLAGSTIYTTHHPCIECANLIATAGIIEVVYLNPYRKEYDLAAQEISRVNCVNFTGNRLWEL